MDRPDHCMQPLVPRTRPQHYHGTTTITTTITTTTTTIQARQLLCLMSRESSTTRRAALLAHCPCRRTCWPGLAHFLRRSHTCNNIGKLNFAKRKTKAGGPYLCCCWVVTRQRYLSFFCFSTYIYIDSTEKRRHVTVMLSHALFRTRLLDEGSVFVSPPHCKTGACAM